MVCSYVDGMTSFDFTWTKDGANFQPSSITVGNGVLATVPVPNEEYLSSLEETYTCPVSLGGDTRGSRNIIVTLPGEPHPVCTSPTSHTHPQSLKVVSCTMTICCIYSGFEVTCPDCDLQSALDHAARDK